LPVKAIAGQLHLGSSKSATIRLRAAMAPAKPKPAPLTAIEPCAGMSRFMKTRPHPMSLLPEIMEPPGVGCYETAFLLFNRMRDRALSG
jgi:hypothetical protein